MNNTVLMRSGCHPKFPLRFFLNIGGPAIPLSKGGVRSLRISQRSKGIWGAGNSHSEMRLLVHLQHHKKHQQERKKNAKATLVGMQIYLFRTPFPFFIFGLLPPNVPGNEYK